MIRAMLRVSVTSGGLSGLAQPARCARLLSSAARAIHIADGGTNAGALVLPPELFLFLLTFRTRKPTCLL